MQYTVFRVQVRQRECVREENTANRNHLWLPLDVGVAGNIWKAAIVNMPKSKQKLYLKL